MIIFLRLTLNRTFIFALNIISLNIQVQRFLTFKYLNHYLIFSFPIFKLIESCFRLLYEFDWSEISDNAEPVLPLLKWIVISIVRNLVKSCICSNKIGQYLFYFYSYIQIVIMYYRIDVPI